MTIERLGAIGLFVLIALVGQAVFRRWNNPSTVLAAPWIVLFVGQLLFARDFPFSVRALVVLTLIMVPFVMGTALAAIQWRDAPAPTFRIVTRDDLPHRWRQYLWGAAIVVSLYFLIQLRVGLQQGFISFDGSPVNPYALSDHLLASGLAYPFRLAQALSYVAVLFAGIELARTRRIHLPTMIILGGMLAVSIVTSLRTPALLTISVLAVALLVWNRISLASLNLRAVLLGSVGLILVVGIASAAFSRRFDESGRTQSYIAESVVHSLLASPSSFSLYLDNSDDWHYGNLNRTSLQGPLALVGLQTRSITIYEGYYLTRVTNQDPNVFTALRFLLDDVGIGGTVVLMTIFGFAVGHLYSAFYARPTLRKGAVLSALLLLIAWLPLTFLPSYVYWFVLVIVPPLLLPQALRLELGSQPVTPEPTPATGRSIVPTTPDRPAPAPGSAPNFGARWS